MDPLVAFREMLLPLKLPINRFPQWLRSYQTEHGRIEAEFSSRSWSLSLFLDPDESDLLYNSWPSVFSFFSTQIVSLFQRCCSNPPLCPLPYERGYCKTMWLSYMNTEWICDAVWYQTGLRGSRAHVGAAACRCLRQEFCESQRRRRQFSFVIHEDKPLVSGWDVMCKWQ